MASHSNIPSASSCLLFNPQEYEEFKAQVTENIMALQRMYQVLCNSFAMEKEKCLKLADELNSLSEQIKLMPELLANLQLTVIKAIEENAKFKDENADLEDAANKRETLKKMIERVARMLDEIQSRMAPDRPDFFVPQNFSNALNALEEEIGMHGMHLAENNPMFQKPNLDGTLMWKIGDFQRRRDEAKHEGALSINSQPFYTSRYGYKMCLRIYLNGNETGRNTHISLYFVLMKGEYDALLPFPFEQKVSLFLLDQGPDGRHLTDTFRPDPSCSSFKKPTSDMNIASGCPMFVAHDTLIKAAYVVHDTIFVRAVVDTADLENF